MRSAQYRFPIVLLFALNATVFNMEVSTHVGQLAEANPSDIASSADIRVANGSDGPAELQSAGDLSQDLNNISPIPISIQTAPRTLTRKLSESARRLIPKPPRSKKPNGSLADDTISDLSARFPHYPKDEAQRFEYILQRTSEVLKAFIQDPQALLDGEAKLQYNLPWPMARPHGGFWAVSQLLYFKLNSLNNYSKEAKENMDKAIKEFLKDRSPKYGEIFKSIDSIGGKLGKSDLQAVPKNFSSAFQHDLVNFNPGEDIPKFEPRPKDLADLEELALKLSPQDHDCPRKKPELPIARRKSVSLKSSKKPQN